MAPLAISRRLFLRNTAAASAVATTIAVPAMAEPTLEFSPEDRLIAARAEFIAALKAMHPGIQDWRSVEEEPHNFNVVFMIVGRKQRTA